MNAILNPLREIAERLQAKIDPATQIQCTRDYDSFKTCGRNRKVDIDQKSFRKLLEAVKDKNLLACHPIIVNSKMEVIDGQHRLRVAKILKTPIYYIVSSSIEEGDISTINDTRKSWVLEDYLNSFLKTGSEDYKLLKDFCAQHTLKLSIGLQIISHARKQTKKTVTDQFKHGQLKFPRNEESHGVDGVMESCSKCVDLIKTRVVPIPRYLYTPAFKMGLINFLSHPKIDSQEFLVKLETQLTALHLSIYAKDYREQFLNIYNFHKKNKINLD